MPDFEFEHVDLGYRGQAILKGIDLALEPGRRIGILGENGAGKSTLVRALLGILPPLGGRVRSRPGLRIGFVPQRERFDPIWPLRVEEVLFQGLVPEKGFWPRLTGADRIRISEVLEAVQLEGFEARTFRSLSGGQQQRVLFARALIANPDWLILDEPTAGLDFQSQMRLLELLDRLSQSREKLGVLLVSHRLVDLLTGMNELILVQDGKVELHSIEEARKSEELSRMLGRKVHVDSHCDSYAVHCIGPEDEDCSIREEA